MLVTLENNRDMTQNRKRARQKRFARKDKTLHRITRAVCHSGHPSIHRPLPFASPPLRLMPTQRNRRQRITHFRCFILPHLPFILSLSARLKTSLTPLPVLALHSMYFAPISFATVAPCSEETGVRPCAESMRFVCSSERRSILVATSRSGVPSQKCATSGCHCQSGTAPQRFKFMSVTGQWGVIEGRGDEEVGVFVKGSKMGG
jgi:hypothetical protein